MNLVIDFGNSTTKAAIFRGLELIKIVGNQTETSLQQLITEYEPERIWVGTVNHSNEEIMQILGNNVEFFNHKTPLPFTNLYRSPETIGLDRLAGVAAAQALFPNQNSLIIDAGTCITYDLITKNSEYLGGAISPGIRMKCKALHIFTQGLPLIEPIINVSWTGSTTKESILSGVVNGTIGEIQSFINRYQSEYGDLQIILCGGEANFFENKLKGAIFAAPDLVLQGLNRILRYNADEKN